MTLSSRFKILAFAAMFAISGCVDLAITGPVSVRSAKANNVVAEPPGLGHFAEPLLCVGSPAAKEELAALAKAVQQYERNHATDPDDFTPLEDFLKTYPHSPYRASIQLNLGLLYRHSGYCSKSLAALQDAWGLLRKATESRVKALADRTLGELTVTLTYLGRCETLEPLLKEVKSRKLSGSATEWVTNGVEGLHKMRTLPGLSFRCGPLALSRICESYAFAGTQELNRARALIDKCESTAQGTSMSRVFELSRECRMKFQMAFRSPGAVVLPNSVMHWRAGHFSALLDKVGNRYQVEDATNIFTPVRVTSACLDQEASGYFLVAAGPLPPGWRTVSASEGNNVWGRGVTPFGEDGDVTPTDQMAFCPCACKPMTTWNVHAMLVSLTLQDTPVGIGSAAFSVPFQVVYAQREIAQPAIFTYTNFGPKWSCNWLSTIKDQIATNGKAVHYARGGGIENYTFPIGSSTSDLGVHTHAILKKTVVAGTTVFVREMSDGSSETFGKALGDQYFMTNVTDSSGNTVSINYDSQMRIVSITDSSNRVMTVAYELAQDPLKVTSVTDQFGRSAQFAYTPDGHLASITDVLGITSSYVYGANDFVNSLTTPYGTTTFSYGDRSTDTSLGTARFLTATDPAGRTSRVEYRDVAPGIGYSDPSVPVGIPLYNIFLSYRNTFSWTPEQLAGGIDYTKATIYHFLHAGTSGRTGGITGRTLESIKKPLENRIWFSYLGQAGVNFPVFEGTTSLVTGSARLLGDGTTQLTKNAYNSKGNLTQTTDPSGRVYDYGYASNQIDLISVSRGAQLLMSATYDGNHNVVSLTDASGGTSSYTYDSRGLVQTATNALGETTTYGYTPTGNLSSIQSPLNAVTTFGYNAQEQLSSATDSEGYTVTASHDAADRPTGVTYPDGTTDTITYDRLDVGSTKDRKDRVTKFQHDDLQRLTQVTDANAGITGLDYGLEDAPNLLTDPAGRQTQFVYDLQQRLSVKQYAGGATQTTTYQNCCGRLRTITDALGHTKTFTYYLDNTLKAIDYSGATPSVNFTNDPFLPRPLSMTDGQGVTTYNYVPVGSPGADALASVSGPLGDTAAFTYDSAGRMTGRTINGASETQTFDPLWRTTSTSNALDTFTMGYLGTTGQVTSVNSTLGPTMQYAYGANIADRRLAQIKNLNRVGGAVTSQFDFQTNPVGEINQIIETHGGGTTTPTPTPTTTNTTTPTPTVTPPGDDDDDEHGHGNGHGDDHGGNGHDNHGNGGHKDKDKHKDNDDRQHGLIFLSPDITRTGTTTLVLTLWGALVLYTLAQPRTRRTLVAQIASLGLVGALALNGCLVGTVSTGAGTSVVYDYSYDNLSQLIGVNINSTPAATFGFDGAGNLLSLTAGNTTTGFTYNALNQRTTPGVNVYDAKGQTTDKDGRIFEWDDDGRMTAIVDGTHRSEFGYDGAGRRIKIAEFDNGVITSKKLYWWLGGEIVTERDGLAAGFPIQKQYFGQGVIANGVKLFYTFDQLGSVRELIDSAGVVRADYRYSTYGERTKESGDLDSDWGYAGLWHHGPSGLDLATHRTYDSAQGRWISRDPLGEVEGYNLYAYCENDPISCVDTDGRGKIKVLVEAVTGAWRYVWKTKGTVANNLRKQGKNTTAKLNKRQCKNIAEEAWDEVVWHAPHGGKSKLPHAQPKNRRGSRGHLNQAPHIIGATLGVDLLGHNILGQGADMFNPAGDVSDVVGLLAEPAVNAGEYYGQLSLDLGF